MGTVSRAEQSPAEALRRKYERIRRMRLAHEDGTEGDPRPLMRELAADFPGALRDLDELPMETIEARLSALSSSSPPPWAEAMARYHGWMRLALAIKRRFRPGSDPALARRWALDERAPRPDEPDEARLDVEAIAAILRPPGGRLSRWVLRRVADETGRPLEDVERDVFKRLKKT